MYKGIAEDEQLAHAGGEGHLGPLAGRDEPLIEGAVGRIGAGGRDGIHVEGGPDGGPAAPDAVAAAPGAAVAIEVDDADQGGQLSAREDAEF